MHLPTSVQVNPSAAIFMSPEYPGGKTIGAVQTTRSANSSIVNPSYTSEMLFLGAWSGLKALLIDAPLGDSTLNEVGIGPPAGWVVE